MAWRLAKSLEKLRSQINAAFPARSKASDGSIGDTSHQARGKASDHNPNAQGVVTAIDITHDPEHGVDGKALSRALAKDKRAKYVIFAGEIYRSYKPNLGWAKYRGANSHHHHVHVSVLAKGYDDESPWFNLGQGEPKLTVSRSTLRRGSPEHQEVRLLQEKLQIPVDGIFGVRTDAAVRQFQKKHGLTIDGIVGSVTWKALDLK